MKKRLTVNIIVPFVQKTGGMLVIIEHILQLKKRGHSVNIYYPYIPYFHLGASDQNRNIFSRIFFDLIKPTLGNLKRRIRVIDWHTSAVEVIPVLWVSSWTIRKGDIALATAWPTAFSVAALKKSKGKKFYFIQHYETWNGYEDLVDDSYKLPLGLITISPWLTELMESKFNRKVTGEIHNGIDTNFFRPGPARVKSDLKLLFIYQELEFKGPQDALYVIRQIHEQLPEVKVSAFGFVPLPSGYGYIHYNQNPAIDQILKLYQEADIFINTALTEGWCLPVVEALATECAVVTTNVGCVPLLIPDEVFLVSMPGDREDLLENTRQVIENPELRKKLSKKGVQAVKKFSWQKFSENLEKVFLQEIE